MPPYDYDPNRRQFRDAGRYISHKETRAAIDRLTDFVKKQAARYARQFDNGTITATEFNLAMRELLKSAHIVSASVGRGGRERMTQKDWGRVGRKLQWQYGYLDKFTRRLERGGFASTVTRSKAYVNAVYVSYASAFKEAQTEFIEGGGNTNPNGGEMARLVQNSQEGCDECNADADLGWMPVEEMGDIGSRICGDFCKCDIEYSDSGSVADYGFSYEFT
jgi:hypothetical protein